MASRKMNFREYWDAVGTANIELIVAECGSSLKYFRMLRYGIKKISRNRALQILEAARKHTAPFEPDLELLLEGVPRAGVSAAKEITPSTSYLRARQRLLAKGEETAEA